MPEMGSPELSDTVPVMDPCGESLDAALAAGPAHSVAPMTRAPTPSPIRILLRLDPRCSISASPFSARTCLSSDRLHPRSPSILYPHVRSHRRVFRCQPRGGWESVRGHRCRVRTRPETHQKAPFAQKAEAPPHLGE